MKENWLKLTELWSSLAQRERQAIALLGTFLAIVILYLWFWSPLQNAVIAERKRIQTDQHTLVQMQAADKAIQNLEGQTKKRNPSVTPIVLLGILQKQVDEEGMTQTLTQLKQAGNA